MLQTKIVGTIRKFNTYRYRDESTVPVPLLNGTYRKFFLSNSSTKALEGEACRPMNGPGMGRYDARAVSIPKMPSVVIAITCQLDELSLLYQVTRPLRCRPGRLLIDAGRASVRRRIAEPHIDIVTQRNVLCCRVRSRTC